MARRCRASQAARDAVRPLARKPWEAAVPVAQANRQWAIWRRASESLADVPHRPRLPSCPPLGPADRLYDLHGSIIRAFGISPGEGLPHDRRFALAHGSTAWAEFGWAGAEIEVGGARLGIIRRTQRCAATNVDPETAARDMNVPQALKRGFGHVDMGVYAEVVSGGAVATGDRIDAPERGV